MLFAEAVFMIASVILHNSGVQGERNQICALKGSSVNLSCYTYPYANPRCYSVHKFNTTYIQKDIETNQVTFNVSEDSNTTLTFNHVTDADANIYCCSDHTEQCWINGCQLQVADLQVKVLPTEPLDEGTVTLMCTTSCDLTEKPTSYIWYKNGQFLYEDWSPWYQEALMDDKGTTYSCAIKGHEAVRAPHVSVDSVSSACFTVHYAEGRMCSNEQKSAEKPCSITYPKDVSIHEVKKQSVLILECNSSCPQTSPHNDFRWFISRKLFGYCENQYITVKSSDFNTDTYTCAVKGHEDLHSDEFSGSAITYSLRRVCALEGSSVTISSHGGFAYDIWKFKSWYEPKTEPHGEIIEGDVEVNQDQTNLTMKNLMKNNSGEYMRTNEYQLHEPDYIFPGMILIITGVKVTMFPSAVVTEGHRVTLTCTTSCPLTHKSTYVWFFNRLPLTLKNNLNKHLVLDPVSLHHAGNYSCSVKAPQNVSSSEVVLTVQSLNTAVLTLNAIKVALLLLITLGGCLSFYIRRKTTPALTTKPRTKIKTEQIEQRYESIALKTRNPVAAPRK